MRAEDGPIDTDAAEAPGGKIAAIQLLRALAALTVAAAHVAFAFADFIGPGLGLPQGWQAGREGQVAVLVFFIVSGHVMVTAAGGSFGQPGARGRFWRRRIIRIMPPYWLASLLLAAVLAGLFGQAIDPGYLLASLALIPSWPATGELRPLVFLWVGWTLVYEMSFYFWFGLVLPLPRARAMGLLAGVLGAIILAGTWVPPVNPLLYALTRPVSAMFVAGMALALWRGSGGAAAAPWRWLALLAVIPAFALIPAPAVPSAMGWDYLAWAGFPALLIACAALGGPMALPAAASVNRAGDMSYALYLLHVPLAWGWLWLWPRLPLFDAGPWDFFASAMLAIIAASWGFHRWIERPLTRALNRWS